MTDFILAFLGVIGSFGIVQVMLSRDAEAITKCRFLCFELKRLLEEFADYPTISSRNPQNDLPKLKEIKKVVEQLYVEKEGLTFPCYLLNRLLEESLPLFDKVRTVDGNPTNQPYFVGSNLLQLWGIERDRPFRFSKLVGAEKFLYKSFFRRSLAWVCSLFERK